MAHALTDAIPQINLYKENPETEWTQEPKKTLTRGGPRDQEQKYEEIIWHRWGCTTEKFIAPSDFKAEKSTPGVGNLRENLRNIFLIGR